MHHTWFQSTCRLVLCINGSFLKHKCGGHILVTIALDANNHLYDVTFAMVDSQKNNLWMYFTLQLREAIGEVKEFNVFI